MSQRVVVYIDGFNLYFAIKQQGWQHFLWLDVHRLSLNLLYGNQRLDKVHYFTSRISDNPNDKGKVARQKTYLEAVKSLPDVCIYLGYYRRRKVHHKKCGLNHKFPEEKMTDVNLVVKLLEDAHDDKFDTAIIVSSDNDLIAAVKSVCTRHQNKKVVMYFPPNRNSKEFRKVASNCLSITRSIVAKSQLPNPVTINNRQLWRPNPWNK